MPEYKTLHFSIKGRGLYLAFGKEAWRGGEMGKIIFFPDRYLVPAQKNNRHITTCTFRFSP